MAILTPVVGERLAEIDGLVASGAPQIGMLPQKREPRGVVTERRAQPGAFPAGSAVTAFARAAKAGLLKGAAVRVGMTCLASCEGNASETRRFFAWPGSMALLAVHCLVHPGQRETRAPVVEARSWLPRLLGMATGAPGAQLAAMLVRVAIEALAAKAQERVAEILELDRGASITRNPPVVVARLAFLPLVRALEDEAGLFAMIEFSTLQAGELESAPIVLHVAARAIPLGRGRFVSPAVQAGVYLNAPCDLSVTIQTFERAAAGAEIVAGRASGDSFQLLMGSRQGPR